MNARFSAPKGRNVIAQGRAQRRPGFRVPHDFPALQGRHNTRLGIGELLAVSMYSATFTLCFLCDLLLNPSLRICVSA